MRKERILFHKYSFKKLMKFSKDIQGLRGIAVLFVLFYHLYPAKNTGGFIGVDIFFSISGYLVCNSIEKRLQNENESFFLGFYAARLRRLLPSSIVVIFILTIYTYKYDISNFYLFQRDALSCIFIFANYHFYYNKIDYFHSGLKESALLHYWSLSLEEQFYIVMPVLLWFSSNNIIAIYIILIIISFGFCIYYGYKDKNKGYFFLTSRSWEFVLSALSRYIPLQIKSHYMNYTSIIAIVLLLFLSVYLNDSFIYPSYNAMFPILVSILILNFANENYLLINKPILLLGNLSYSIYLIHYPLIKTMIRITISYYIVLIVSVLVSYYLIEFPFYRGCLVTSNGLTYLLSFFSIVLLNVCLLICYKEVKRKLKNHYSSKELIEEQLKYYKHPCSLSNYNAIQDSSILFIGDSHIGQYMIAFIINRDLIKSNLIHLYIHRNLYLSNLNLIPLLKYKFNLCLFGSYIDDEKIFDNINNNNTLSKFSMCKLLFLSNDNPHHNIDPNSCLDVDKRKCYGEMNKTCFLPKEYSFQNSKNIKIVTFWDNNIIEGRKCYYYRNNIPIYADFNHLSLLYIKSISKRIIGILMNYFVIKNNWSYNKTCKYYII